MANPLLHNMSPAVKAFVFLMFTFLFGIIGSIATGAIAAIYFDFQASQIPIILTGEMNVPNGDWVIRAAALGNQLFGFLLASWLFTRFVGKASLQPQYWRSSLWILAAPLIYVLYNPILEGLIVLNEMMIPEGSWIEGIFKPLEESAARTMDLLLGGDSKVTLVINLLIIGVLPAIGEEWAFRGIIQGQLAKTFKNEHIAIWVTGIVFSAYHVQFYGFFPRMIMGVIFGYLLIYTRSIWVPIALHFVNNATAVILTYLDNNGTIDMEQMAGESTEWVYLIPTTILLIGVFLYLRKRSDWDRHKDEYVRFEQMDY